MTVLRVPVYAGPADGMIVEITHTKKAWTSPQGELYLIHKVWFREEGYKSMLVWSHLDMLLLDPAICRRIIREAEDE